jgi:hypothetical protein
VLISQTVARIERFARHGDDWLFTEVSGRDESMTLASIDCILSLREVYDKVQFPPAGATVV